MTSRSVAVAIVLAAVVALCTTGYARHHTSQGPSSSGGGTPGQFDFYLLTLSWAPQFCATHPSKPPAIECDPGRHYGFIVHGLWPQYENGGYPDSCAPAQPVSHDVVERTLAIIPSRGLIQHEWAAHGTCSGMSAQDYFNVVEKAYKTVQIPTEFRSVANPATVSPAEIEQKFAAANGAPKGSFRISCSSGEFVAVEACLTRDLQFRDCGKVRECRAPQVTVRPTP